MTGALSGGELQKLYSKDFVVFEAKAAVRYEQNDELRKLATFAFTPNFVFLDSSGKKVLEHQGFRTPREAKALHDFVTKKHYQKTSYREFLAAYPPQ
jgi:thioredoxin-related protein